MTRARSLRRVAWLFAPAFVCAAFGASNAFAQQTLTVQQVEAFENPPTNTHYAPINFNGSTTATDPSYTGITFHAQANTTDTASSHAFFVSQRFYINGTVAQPYINNVYNDSANDFINSLNAQGTLGPGQTAPTLNFSALGIKVSNNSYVADFGNATADENGIRRLDFVINRDNAVVTAAAVTGGTFANQNLVWSARNVLAVTGDSSTTPFDPSAGAGNTITSGRRRADIWSDEEASFATGRVSGYATGLIGQATSQSMPNATNSVVVRSLLMSGADKSAVGTVQSAWTRDTTNNLDITAGAGKANYAESLSILSAGARTPQTVTGSNTANVSTTNLKGWAFASSTSGQQAIVFQAAQGIAKLTATLNWNVTQTTTGPLINTDDANRQFANLALELRPVTLSGGQFVLGSAIGRTGLSSNASLDNVEHLYYDSTTGGGVLADGYYAFLITGDSSLNTNYGFSYDVVASNLPEPGSVLTIFGGAILLLRRSRRTQSAS
jgi:hypothetical protein